MIQEMQKRSALETAAEWFVRLRDEAVSAEDRAAFEAWYDANPTHAEAHHEMEQLWASLDQIEPPPVINPEIVINSEIEENDEPAPRKPAVPDRRRALKRLALAASLLLAVTIGGYTATPPGYFTADHRTAAGAQQQITLADGSTVHLGTATAISVKIGPEERRITLHDGEAYFDIAPDEARPFIVEAAVGRIQALGTSFSVRRSRDAVDVIVTEHKVEVWTASSPPAVLSQGQHIRVDGTKLGNITEVDTDMGLSWRRGRLVFDNRPLGEVLAELERYRAGRILVLDNVVETLPVTGSFAITDTDATLQTIERTLPVRIRRASNLLVLVDAKPDHLEY